MGLCKECAKKVEPFPGRGWSIWVGLTLKASFIDYLACRCIDSIHHEIAPRVLSSVLRRPIASSLIMLQAQRSIEAEMCRNH